MNPSAATLLESLECSVVPPLDAWRRLELMLEEHADTAFGREFGFASIRSPEDFRNAIPVMDYEEHHRWIKRAAAGEVGALACGKVTGFERTSGTSSAAKWIPLTDGLREEFGRGLASWFGGWKKRRPEVFAGRAYWAISPPGMLHETAPGGLPVGINSDAAYFPDEIGGRLAEWLVAPELSGSTESIFEETAEALLSVPDLSLVSVWSPTFLLGIDAALRRMRSDFSWSDQFPKLAMVSCWADASSAPWIPRLRERLGDISIEAKGLLATEGITSLPDAVDGSPRFAAECHWHEFLDERGCFVPTHDLQPGEIYEVLFTTAGGLYRYRSGDRVRVTGIGGDGLPRLRFIGRKGMVSDLVGEKLTEEQVIEALAGHGFLLADAAGPGYVLWLEEPSLAARIECLLRRNPYFDQALAIQQLAPIQVWRLATDWNLKLTRCLAEKRGCRIGDVKPPHLLTGIAAEEVASWLG